MLKEIKARRARIANFDRKAAITQVPPRQYLADVDHLLKRVEELEAEVERMRGIADGLEASNATLYNKLFKIGSLCESKEER